MFKKFALCTITLFTLLSLGACKSQSQSQSENDTYKMTDAKGHEVAVPKKPKRIIASYLEDYVISLGDTPVAQWTVGKGSIQNYLQEDLKDVPTINYDLPYEDVLKFEPDLLLIGADGTLEGGKYKEYAKIAPTYVVINGPSVPWKDQLTEIGKVLGKQEKAKEVIKDYDTLVKQTKESLGDKISGKSAAIVWITNNSAFMVADNRASGRLIYQDLGFNVPTLTKEVSEKATADFSPVSLESLSQLDADYLFLVNSDSNAAMLKDPLWQSIPAVKNKQVFSFDKESSWLYTGPIANTKMIKDVDRVLK